MGIFNKLRGGAGAGRGDDAHNVTTSSWNLGSNSLPVEDKTRSTGLNTRFNETRDRNEVGVRHGGPKSAVSGLTGKVYINLHDNYDGGKTWVGEDTPAGKAQSKSDKRDAKALNKINKPRAMEKSRKRGQAYDAAKAAEDRVDNSWLKPGGMKYMGSDQETADKATVKAMKTDGVKGVQKRMKDNPSMMDDAQDARSKRIMDENKKR
jgi:hypothetical protein